MNNKVYSKNSYNSKLNVKLLAFTAMFAALVAVATAFIKIPTALGYQHPGDSMVYLAACILPGPYGIIAPAVGGALADIISGYAYWAIPTFIIKGLNAAPFVVCTMILKKYSRDNRIINIPTLAMLIPTTAVTVFGYLIANAIIYDWTAAMAELITWWVQPGVGAIIFVAAGLGLDSIKFKQRICSNITRK